MKTRLRFTGLQSFCTNSITNIRKIKISICLSAFLYLLTINTNAQVSAYSFSENAGTYAPGATLGTPASFFNIGWNDDAAAYILPFDFTYNGNTYTTDGSIGVSANGWIAFGTGSTFTFTGTGNGGSYVSGANPNGLYLNGSSNNNGVAGFNGNLADQAFTTFTGTRTNTSYFITGIAPAGFTNIQIGTRLTGTGISNGTVVLAFNSGAGTITMSNPATANSSAIITPRSSVYGYYEGTAPNRTMVIQWTQVRRTGIVESFSFQIRINEAGGIAANQRIEVVYGTCTTTGAAFNVQAGLRGNSNADFNARTTSTNWTATTAATLNTDGLTESTTVFPPSGRTYIWTPPAPSTPLCGTIHIGAAQPFPYNKVSNAINYLNYNGVSCDVTFLLDDINYTIGETFPIVVKPYTGSSTFTVTLKPKPGGTSTIFPQAAVNAATIFDLRSANKFIIDGSNTVGGTTKDMTIFNTYTSGSTIRFVNGANNNIVKNNIINGENTLTGVIHISTSGGATGNNNNTIQNNDITYGSTKPISGIYMFGTSGLPNTNTLITQNNISNFYLSGIQDDGNSSSTVISYNKIFGTVTQATNATGELYGILLTDITIVSPQILSNTIYDLKSSNTSGTTGLVTGIDLYDVAPGTCLVANNMISLAGTSPTTPGGAIYGIKDECTSGTTVNTYHNTVSVNGTGVNSGSSVSFTYLKNFTGTSVVKNNIFTNTRVNAGAAKQYTIYKTSTGTLTSNYNDLYSSGNAKNIFGFFTADRADLTAWQGASSQDANSVSTFPNFTSTTDLHIIAPSTTTLNNLGTPVAITSDIDDQTRNGLTPDIGADEFVAPNTGSWVGKTSIDWLIATNWEANVIPGGTTDVTITGGYTFMPTIVTTQAVRNLAFSAPSTPPLLTLNAGTLQINGSLTRTGGSINGSNGTVEMNGTSAQSIPASTFQGNNLKNLTIGNTNNITGVSLSGALDIYGTLSFTGSTKRITTNNNLTLKSTSTTTAYVAEIPVDGFGVAQDIITGNVTVERYIPAKRAWRFLSVPTTGSQTINAAWQEGQAANSPTPAGFGIQITSSYFPNGFDLNTSASSLKTYVPAGNSWTSVTSTLAAFATATPYMTFIRGDRTVNTYPAAATATVLRTKGSLYTGTQPNVPVGTNEFAAINNPYAASIDFRNINKTNVDDKYYVYDPNLGTLGGFQTFIKNIGGDYEVVLGGGSYGSGGDVFNHIQSGQAFFVFSTAGSGTVTLQENDKSNNFASVFKPSNGTTSHNLRTKLFVVNADGSSSLLDGVLDQFDDSYSNDVDASDARKSTNFAENLSLKNGNALLVAESRHTVNTTDTIFYNLTGVGVKQYRFEFVAANLEQEGLAAFLEDRYLNTSTPIGLTDTVSVVFNVVNIPGSYAADRFRLVFQKLVPTPVTITGIGAKRNSDKSIAINWKVENEINMQLYTVERSADGRNFTGIVTTAVKANNGGTETYSENDLSPLGSDNFYRIRALSIGGAVQYSAIVKVSPVKMLAGITVYPNPVTNKIMQVQFNNQPAGNYSIQLINKLGQPVYNGNIQLTAADMIRSIQLGESVAAGTYQLNITSIDGIKTSLQVIIR